MRKLERKYAGELVVIGVHSPKFPGERPTEALEQAVRRLAVGHPVVNDADFRVWQSYAVSAWPTLVFIDPTGKVFARHSGEFRLEEMDAVIGTLIAEFEARGLIDRRPLSFTAADENAADRPLYFPGKVLAAPERGALFVADTGHNRIRELDLETGRLRRDFGCGEPGLVSASAELSRFNQPEGMALLGDFLFVADTENHAVRRIDLGSGWVETVAGMGYQGEWGSRGGPARETALNSPWDVAACGQRLFVAMAGFHQIWEIDLAENVARPFAGSGRENILDGPRTAANFAQPSGLALDARRCVLYVADSEASGVRAIDLADGRVRTLVGEGLFEHGDRDGVGRQQVRLQHPLGVCFDPASGLVYVADSYNHKIKRLDPATTEVRTAFGDGLPGLVDGPAAASRFSEPGGLSVAGRKLYAADTNNHAIRVCDLESGEVETLGVGRPKDEIRNPKQAPSTSSE